MGLERSDRLPHEFSVDALDPRPRQTYRFGEDEKGERVRANPGGSTISFFEEK